MATMKKQRKGRVQNLTTKEYENFFIVAELKNNKCVATHVATESGFRFDSEGTNDIRFMYESAEALAEKGFSA